MSHFCEFVSEHTRTKCYEPATGCGLFCWQHCDTGKDFNRQMMACHDHGWSHDKIMSQYHKIMDKWLIHAHEFHGAPAPKKTHQGNGAYQGAFAFTLTKSPDDNLTEFDMIKAVRKVMSQKSCPVKRYAWYLEYKDNEAKTHPHIHGMYETETQGRIEAKHFKRAWPIWDEKTKLGRGFRGGYHRPIRDEEAYSKYIRKDAGKNEWFNIDGQEADNI